jgi:hypothetical protein
VKASALIFRVAAAFGIIGIAFGIGMAMSHNHLFRSVHAHVTLAGWVSLFLFGLQPSGGVVPAKRIPRPQWRRDHLILSRDRLGTPSARPRASGENQTLGTQSSQTARRAGNSSDTPHGLGKGGVGGRPRRKPMIGPNRPRRSEPLGTKGQIPTSYRLARQRGIEGDAVPECRNSKRVSRRNTFWCAARDVQGFGGRATS